MQVNPSIFKAYDVRGLYPSEINEEVAFAMGQAFAVWSQASQVVVGRDMRISSPAISAELIRGITSMGVGVLDVGLVSTPTFYFAVRHLRAQAGIQVSASHNPKEYNGFKIALLDAEGAIRKVGIESGLAEIRDRMKNEEVRIKNEGQGAVKQIIGIQEAEIDAALKLVPLPHEMPPMTIVADPANAMGAQYLEALFKRIPSINLVRMNFELDGTFPAHQPDPLQSETLKDLQRRVKEEGADLGIAPDGDGDRLFFVDEQGEIVPASHTIALVAAEVLKEHKGEKILYDVRYTWSAKNTIEHHNGIAVMSKVGHAFISEALRKSGGAFAGESSGHFFFRDTSFAEGPLLVLLYVLREMAYEKKPFSILMAPYIHSFESGETNFHLKNREEAKAVMEKLKEAYYDGQLSEIDGIAIEFQNWRFSVRASNTEPLLRLNVEGRTRELVVQKTEELKKMLTVCQ